MSGQYPPSYCVLIGDIPHATEVASAAAATAPTPKRRRPTGRSLATPSTLPSASTARMIAT